MQIIPEKIVTPVELPRISRARLLGNLQESLAGCNSTIINGRAGTGKTMLAIDFARQSGRRVAWYKIDAPDGELRIFFQYLCASVATTRSGFGERTRERVGELIGLEDVPVLVEYFIYELLESDEPLLIVIDDLHLVYDANWVVPFFGRLLPLLPPEVHIMLIGRGLPPAPLWRMRSKQTLHVIAEEALAFTLTETEMLFASYGLPVEAAAGALEQTRGRAAPLDALARSVSIAQEAARIVAAAREHRRSSRPFRLWKEYSRKSSLGGA